MRFNSREKLEQLEFSLSARVVRVPSPLSDRG